MSQRAQVSALATELLTQFQPVDSPDPPEHLHKSHDRVLRALLDQKAATTNQFHVAARLEGLEEKFRIYNNDELADAIHERLDELSATSNRWTPEILSLLLKLSDRPLQETKIEGLDALKPEPQSPPLTWLDIVADDPLDNDHGLWDNVDFARDGSDEDADSIIQLSSLSDATFTTDKELDDVKTDIDALALPPDQDGLKSILKAQFWNQTVQGARELRDGTDTGTEGSVTLTEAQLIREVGFMLHGLPATIFEQQVDDDLVLSSRYQLKHISRGQTSELLKGLGAISVELTRLRKWKSHEQQYPLLQTFQAALARKLTAVEDTLTQIQAQCLRSQEGNTASLLCFHQKVERETRLIRQLGSIVQKLEHDTQHSKRFHVLELLYDGVCFSHSIGDMAAFAYIADVFHTCLQTYLKPLKHWMEFGELSRRDQDIFIQDGKADAPLGDLWARRHMLLLDASGRLHAPRFLHVAGKRILNTGKSVNFLKQLGHSWPEHDAKGRSSAKFDLEPVCIEISANPLSSFSESFDRALNDWIASSYHSSSAVLRQQLETRCGMSRVLDAIGCIYLWRNGALSHTIAAAIFARIDQGQLDWGDRFLLTDLFRTVFAAASCVDTGNLTARASSGSIKSRSSMDSLSTLRIMYPLSWPVANIISEDSMKIYQRVFILLLQLQRAKMALERRFPRVVMTRLMKDPVGVYAGMLRHRMLLFANTVLSYLMDLVLSSATAEMRQRLARSGDVEELISNHQAYIARLNEQCLLSMDRQPVLQAITSLLDLAIVFTEVCTPHGSRLAPRHGDPSRSSDSSEDARFGRRPRKVNLSSSDHEGSEDQSGSDSSHVTHPLERPSAARLKSMHKTFEQLKSFILVSLQSASRGREDDSLEMLTDMLAVEHVEDGLRYG
ncbi:MAG: hypothetical protein L6R39_003686 [Caloplaca ligustica]|nr:MAG: hypothetical protein L6R39_003686 [Caloplaca ligustica]